MELIRAEHDVEIYAEDNNLIMFVDGIKTLTLDKKFASILNKSFDDLVEMRKQTSKP